MCMSSFIPDGYTTIILWRLPLQLHTIGLDIRNIKWSLWPARSTKHHNFHLSRVFAKLVADLDFVDGSMFSDRVSACVDRAVVWVCPGNITIWSDFLK